VASQEVAARENTPHSGSRRLMRLKPGDRLTDATGEWEVVGQPYTTAGGKNARVRVSESPSPAATIYGRGARTRRPAWSEPELHWRYHPAMAWRARCYDCGQEAPITRPLYGKQSLFADGDLGLAIATYGAHPRKPTDTRSCSAVSKTVPQYQMRKAHSTTPGEDPPQVAPRSTPPRRTSKR